MAFPLLPAAIIGGGALIALALGGKKKQPTLAPEPRRPAPRAPIAVPIKTAPSAPLPVPADFAPSPPKAPPMVQPGHVASTPTGPVIFTNPETKSETFATKEGGQITVLQPTEIVGKPTPTEAQVKSGQGTDPGKGKRTGKAYFKWVQQSLNIAENLSPKLGEDGIMGPKSLAAVKAFQKKHGLQVDGIVGLNTENKLIDLANSLPPYTFA